MPPLFGSTRSVVTSHYALLAPESHISSLLPGWAGAQCVLAIAPQIGARFAHYLVTLDTDTTGSGNTNARELCCFVEQGEVLVEYRGAQQGAYALAAGGYCYLPPAYAYIIRGQQSHTRLAIFERTYTPLPDVAPPAPLAGNEQEVVSAAFMGDEDAQLKTLLPDIPAFDMAVNLFTFQPGTALPLVEMHIMEHGLLMLQGQGVYRLGDDWHPVQAGDIIWMAPYCPQWFVAMGKTPARYLYYKDVNRDPFTP